MQNGEKAVWEVKDDELKDVMIVAVQSINRKEKRKQRGSEQSELAGSSAAEGRKLSLALSKHAERVTSGDGRD